MRIGTLGQGVMSNVFRSSDNQIIAVGVENTIHWFDGVTFEEMGSYKLGLNGIQGITFSPDNQLVGIESGLSKAQIIDIYNQNTLATLTGLNGPIMNLSITPDNSYAAFLMVDMRAGDFVGLWNIKANKMERIFDVINPDEPHSMSGPAISPDGTSLAAGCDKQVYIWDLANGQKTFILEGHTKNVWSVAFSPDGKVLASGGRDWTVRLWDVMTGKLLYVISGMTDEVSSVLFSPDGKELTIGNWRGPTHSWNLNEKTLTPLILQAITPDPFAIKMHQRGYSQNWLPGDTGKVLFSPEGKHLAVGSEPILLWDIDKQTVISSLEGRNHRSIIKMQYSPNGRWLAALDDVGSLRLWDVQNGEIGMQKESGFFSGDESGGRTWIFAFSPDNTLLALDNLNTIEVWDVVDTAQVFSIQLDQGVQSVDGLAFSSNGNQLYIFHTYDEMQVAETWDINERKLLHKLEFNTPEKHWEASGTYDVRWPYYARNNADQDKSWIEIWNLETGLIALQVQTPSSFTEPIWFSPDGSIFMAISKNRLHGWNTATGQLDFVFYQVPLNAGIAISSDNNMLAIERSGRVELWDISQRE
jgi:WD40 repeat protein